MSLMLDWAKWWVSQGCAVFPLPPLRKKAVGLGIKSATTDLTQLALWWDAEPESNIGVVGDPAATDKFLLRVDVDVKKGGIQGWERLTTAHVIPNTLTVSTPSGGRHYYFWSPEPLTNATGILPPGIDIRGHSNGYTVGAPSATAAVPKESEAGRYSIEVLAPIAVAPVGLLDLIMARATPIRAAMAEESLKTVLTAETHQDLRDALLSPAMLRDWERWSDNGLALLSLGDAGYTLWVEYSARQLDACPEYPPGSDDADSWWNRHVNTAPKSDYRSIFARAQSLGWRNPRAIDPRQLGFGVASIPQLVPPAPTGPRFRLVKEDEFADGPEPVWRIEQLIPQFGLGMIYGPPGCGKSFFTLDMLMSIADGRRYGIEQKTVRQGRVIYVMGEGAAGMRARVRAYRHLNPALADSQFHIIQVAPNLMDSADVGQLMQTIVEAGGADVVAFDTMHACMAGGDENSAKDMGVVLANCRAIASCINGFVLLIHHTGKDAERGARGSTAIPGAMEVEIELCRLKDDIRGVRIKKQRDGDDGQKWEFRLDTVVDMQCSKPFSSAAVVHLAAGSRDAEKEALKASADNDFVVNQVLAMAPQYEGSLPLEVLLVGLQRLRSDMNTNQLRRCVTRAIDRGMLSIDSDSNVKAVGFG